MRRIFLFIVLFGASPLAAAEERDFDPGTVSEADAINCQLDVPSYNGFALSVSGEDGLAARRHWRKVDSVNPFLDEYELPVPILVTGAYQTRRIAFTSTGILAILDLADPGTIAREEGISNAADPEPLIAQVVASGKAARAEIEAGLTFRKFLGERILVETTELPANGASFGARTIIARNVSNATTHPDKTFYGCSYRIELIDQAGKPL